MTESLNWAESIKKRAATNFDPSGGRMSEILHEYPHLFHIPVMGTGYTVDTPIRLAPFGISAVISLVDDILLEQVRNHYAKTLGLEYEPIPRKTPDGRAKRVKAYLDQVGTIVQNRIAEIRAQPFFEENDKNRYFSMLPTLSPVRELWQKLINNPESSDKEQIMETLNQNIIPGSIDVNIMVKLDADQHPEEGPDSTDAKTALKGFAESFIDGGIVFSAGINQGLFKYMTRFPGFYRDEMGKLKKRIILKVSDFRSALIQGRFLARKGLEVSEFRIESGLNCGGHAFASDGELLPALLKEFSEQRSRLFSEVMPQIKKYYEKQGWDTDRLKNATPPVLTVQGGIGHSGEKQRLMEEYGVDRTGWGSPFLLVPEATPVDDALRLQLAQAKPEDLYLSHTSSPIGVPFNNLRNSASEVDRENKIAAGKPGSACPKGFLVTNTEFSERMICTASMRYQKNKLKELNELPDSPEKDKQIQVILERSCICHQLGHSALIRLGEVQPEKAPQCVCPGPNVAWFTREYTLEEMTDNIYGRNDVCLVPDERPHMFAKEIEMYVEYFEKLSEDSDGTEKTSKYLHTFHDNLIEGMKYALEIAGGNSYPHENLDSIKEAVEDGTNRLSVALGKADSAVA